MIAILYPFRDRDLLRVQRTLNSWKQQTNKNFKVYFINYGSSQKLNKELEKVLQYYPFVTLKHYLTQFQPWNKARALNSVIKNLNESYCFVADIDMIFHPNFMEYLVNFKNKKKVTYFKVGFLNKTETFQTDKFDQFKINFVSSSEATGMSLFPVEALKQIRGFDEFYHFWGAEDTDIHIRLQNLGLNVHFFDKQLLILHQWHPSYRSKETNKVTKELRLCNAVRLNHAHLDYNIKNKITCVNNKYWGQPLEQNELIELESGFKKEINISSAKASIDHFVNFELKELQKGIYCFKFENQYLESVFKQRIKQLVGKPVIDYYTLKEINNLLLMAILVRYSYKKYCLKVNDNLQSIQFILKVT